MRRGSVVGIAGRAQIALEKLPALSVVVTARQNHLPVHFTLVVLPAEFGKVPR